MDTCLLRTIRALSREPGRVCRDFLAGRRVPWMNPIKYALFTATIAFLIQRWWFTLLDAPVTEVDARTREFQNDFGMLKNFLFLPIWRVGCVWRSSGRACAGSSISPWRRTASATSS